MTGNPTLNRPEVANTYSHVCEEILEVSTLAEENPAAFTLMPMKGLSVGGDLVEMKWAVMRG